MKPPALAGRGAVIPQGPFSAVDTPSTVFTMALYSMIKRH